MYKFFLNVINRNAILNSKSIFSPKEYGILIKFSAYRKCISVKVFTMSADNDFPHSRTAISCSVYMCIMYQKLMKILQFKYLRNEVKIC